MKNKLRNSIQAIFPELLPLRNDLMCKVLGPVLLGIELPTHPWSGFVLPQLVMYPLWLPSVSECLRNNLLNKHFLNDLGNQLEVTKEKPNEPELSSNKDRFSINFEQDLPVGTLVRLIDSVRFERPLNAAPRSYLQAVKLQHILTIELLYGLQSAEKTLEKMLHYDWDSAHFSLCRVDVDSWKQDMINLAGNIQSTRDSVAINKRDPKIAKLVESDLIVI